MYLLTTSFYTQIQIVQRLQNKVWINSQGTLNLTLISPISHSLNDSFPSYLSDMLSYASDINTYVTRHKMSNDLKQTHMQRVCVCVCGCVC